MKDVQCYELLGGIALKIHTFSFFNSFHIGLVVRMSILDTEVDGLNPSISMFFSLSKRLYLHCFSRLSCEMSTRWRQPHEGCSVL